MGYVVIRRDELKKGMKIELRSPGGAIHTAFVLQIHGPQYGWISASVEGLPASVGGLPAWGQTSIISCEDREYGWWVGGSNQADADVKIYRWMDEPDGHATMPTPVPDKKAEPHGVGGWTPIVKNVIQIGCLEIPLKGCLKEAKGILKLLRAYSNRGADIKSQVTYKGHPLSIPLVMDFIRYVEKHKLDK